MPLWLLTPMNPDDPAWQASSHRGQVIIRAPNEQRARDVAAAAFDVKKRFTPGGGMRYPPWTRPALVSARATRDARFDEDGPTELLDPIL